MRFNPLRYVPALGASLALGACGYPLNPPALAPVTLPAPAQPAAAAIATTATRAPLTLFVSIDGFRPDYLQRGITPNLTRIAAAGVAGSMQPSFPTLTFPNHYAMATGLRPDRNGMVENKMFDPRIGGPMLDGPTSSVAPFDIHDPKTAREPVWWDEAEPIWVTAEKAGVRTGMMFWPGSDVEIEGTRPGNWFAYDAAVTGRQRVDAVLDWARRPADTRPKLIGLYFDTIDKTAHATGIASPEMAAALGDLDVQIGRLVDGLAAMAQPVNLVIVSDHGMAQIQPDHVLPLASVIDPATMSVIADGGPVLSVWPRPGQDAAVAAALLHPWPHLACRRKQDLPARWHFGANPRVPSFYCLAAPGWRYSAQPAKDHPIGDHGFDNTDPDMRALFLASGPAFAAGKTLKPFDNVDIAPLLRDLVRLPAGVGIDGTDAPFRAVMTKGPR